MADSEVVLPASIAGVLFGKLLDNCKAVAVALERASQITLRTLHLADFIIARREIALPGGRLRGKTLPDRQREPVPSKRGLQIAAVEFNISKQLLRVCD